MLALFFQLKMMQSLQFIATLYDDLSEVTGEKTKPNYTVPPFRQALTTMLTATSQAVVAEIDKSPNPDEFASLKTSLTTSAVAPVKLQIPPNQFEAVKQKTYVKLNKPYTAPPTANSAPATVPPVQQKVYNFEKGNAPLRMGFSWWNSDWSFTSYGSGYIEHEYAIKTYIPDLIDIDPNFETTQNMNSGSDLGIYNNLAYEPFEPIGFTVRKNRNGNVVTEGSSEIEIVSQRHVTGETTVTVSEINPAAPPKILKEFLVTPGSRRGKIGKNSKSVRVDNAIHNFLTFYNVTFKAFKSDGSPDTGLKLQLGERGNYGSLATWIEDKYREEFNVADMSDLHFDIDGQLEFTHGQTREINQIYLIAAESGIQIYDSEDNEVLQHNNNWAVAKVPKRANSKEFMKVSELGCHLIMTRDRTSDSMDTLHIRFADKHNDSDSLSSHDMRYQFANRDDDENDWRQNLILRRPGEWSFTSASTNVVRSITFVSEEDPNEEMIFNAGASNEFKLKSGESYGDNTTTYAQTITEALRGTALINHLDGRQYKLDCRSILQGPKMMSWTKNPTFAESNVEPPTANTAPPPSVDPYAGSNYPGVNVIDMYKVSTGATWDPAQPAFGYGDTGLPRKLNSAELEYVQHTNNDVELTAYSVYNGSKEQLNRYYYKTDERQWYAAYLNTYAFDYVTSAYSLPINVVFRDPYHKEKSANFTITPENYDIMTHTSSGTPGTITTVNVPYTVGPPTANTLPHDMHDMSVQVSYTPAVGTSTVSGVWAAMPLMNPLAAIAPQAANTIATFSTDGLVKVNDATPISREVISLQGISVTHRQADDGSIKVEFQDSSNGDALGTFIANENLEWYVDSTTYKSWDMVTNSNPFYVTYNSFLPNRESDPDAKMVVNFPSYDHIEFSNDSSLPVHFDELKDSGFWFNAPGHRAPNILYDPLTKKENFDTFPGIPDYWKELYNSDYPRYLDQANITYNFKPHNPLWSSATGQKLTVMIQEYGDGYMTIRFEGPGETVLTEFLYSPNDQKVRVEPKANGGNYKLYQMLADDSLVDVEFKAYDKDGNDIASSGNMTFSVQEYQNVRSLYPEHISGIENRLGGTMNNFVEFIPSNNFTNRVPLIQIMDGKFNISVNNKIAVLIRPLNGNPIAYVDHADNQNPKISNHLLVEFGDMGRQLNIYAVHNSAMSSGGMPMIINDPTAKELLTQFEIAWPSNVNDLSTTPMKFRSTPQTRPLNLSYETLSHHEIQRISFVSAVHETDKLVLGIQDVTPWGFTEIKGSTQDPTSRKWYNSFDNDPELIWNALVYDNTFAYETHHHFGNPLPMTVRVELPPQAFGYADYF